MGHNGVMANDAAAEPGLAQVIETLKSAQRMLEPVLASYERRLEQFGADPRSAFWKNEEWQTRRYRNLSRLFEDDDRGGGIVVTDFGCGYGAFFDYLKDRPVMAGSRYIGIDMSERMLDEARTRIPDPRARFERKLVLTEESDYTFACGTFNMNLGADKAEWADYVKASLQQIWSRTRKALGFNMLRPDAPERWDGLYYPDPAEYEAFCREALGRHVEMTIDRPLPDFTIFVRRGPGP